MTDFPFGILFQIIFYWVDLGNFWRYILKGDSISFLGITKTKLLSIWNSPQFDAKVESFFTKMGINVRFSVQYSIQIIQSRGFKGIGFKPKRFKRIGFKPRRFKCMDFNPIGYKRIGFKPIWFSNVIFNSKVILTKSTNESSCAQRELTSFTPWNIKGSKGVG